MIFLNGLLLLHIRSIATKRHLDYPWCKTKNCWCSIDAHFQDGAGSMSLLFLPLKAANTSSMDVSNQSQLILPKMQSQSCWCSVDTYFHNGAVTMLPYLSPITATDMSVMQNSDQIILQLHYLHYQKSLMLIWHSFWWIVHSKSAAIDNCI